ncbi:MAG: hypothetical protein ACPGLV_13445, partial [Bacteroidia bacterium]
MKIHFFLLFILLFSQNDAISQDQRISSIRLNLRAGFAVAQNNSIVNNQGVTMSQLANNQSSYEITNGNMGSRGFGMGLSASLKDIVEIEMGYERIGIVQSFAQDISFYYLPPNGHTNISAIVTDFELNKLSYGGYLNYPLGGKSKKAYVYGSFFLNTAWVDDKTRLRSGEIYKSGVSNISNEQYALDPAEYSGPVYTSIIIQQRFKNIPSIGAGFKYVVPRSGVAWKFGVNYTIGDEVVYKFNHKWYDYGELVNDNDWMHTVQNVFYYMNLGIPLLKGGKEKDEPLLVAEKEKVEEEILETEKIEKNSQTEYPDYPDEGNTSLPNEEYMANNIIFLL